MTMLVTGATGFIGSHLVRALGADGQSVRVLLRDPSKAEALRQQGLEVNLGDIRDAQPCAQAVAGVDVIFHCAAASGRHPSRREIYDTNFSGLRNLLEAIRSNPKVRLVHISGLSVLGMRDLLPATENLPRRRSGDFEANTKIAAEQLILDYQGRYGLDVVVLRPGIVYGPGDDNLSQVRRAIREGGFAYIGSRKNIVPLVHIDDFVEAMRQAAVRAEATRRTYHITDGSQTTIGEIVDYLADLDGSPKPKLVLPYFIPYLGCLLFGSLQRVHLITAAPIEWASLRFLGTSRFVPIDRAQEELGFSPRLRYREGLAATYSDLTRPDHESLSRAGAPG